MKDGTTRMGYKAEHAVDLDTDIVVAVNVQPGNAPDTPTVIDTAIDAAVNAEQVRQDTLATPQRTDHTVLRACQRSGARDQNGCEEFASGAKHRLMMVAARNLSTIMRAIIGIGGPRSLQGLRALMQTAWTHFDRLISALDRLVAALVWSASHGSSAPGG